MDTKNWVYLKLQELTPEVRERNGLNPNTSNRLDCISVYNPNNDLRGLSFFLNRKGQLFFYLAEPIDFVSCDIKRQGSKALTKNFKGHTFNLTSLYIDSLEYPNYAHGNPPISKMLGYKKNKPNPIFAFNKDLYLFIINSDYTEIEFIIIPEEKNMWNTYYNKLIQGSFEKVIQNFRINSTIFYDYGL